MFHLTRELTLCAWLLTALGAQQSVAAETEPTVRELRFGGTATAEIGESSLPIETDEIRSTHGEAVGLRYRIEVPAGQSCTLELRSHFFDAYLVLRDEGGSVLAEDDNGLVRLQARLVIDPAEEASTYLVDACAVGGTPGAFELRAVEGRPQEASAEKERAAILADARGEVEARTKAL